MLSRIILALRIEEITRRLPSNMICRLPGYNYLFRQYHGIPEEAQMHYRDRLLSIKDTHRGERCFIIGTGPSLNKTNMILLKNEVTFGVNTLFTGLPKCGFKCTYWAVSDVSVFNKHSSDILSLDAKLFIGGSAARKYFSNKEYFYQFRRDEPYLLQSIAPMWTTGLFSKNILKGTYIGDTVIIDICLQVAYYMGFQEVYLLGCDCDYSGLHRFDGMRSENKITSAIRGDWYKVFKSYEICREAYEEDSRKIFNATVGGRLEVFERRNLEDVISSE